MKTKKVCLGLIVLLLGTATTAFAAGGREDNSGIFVWVFLGFCALIVVAQLIPALMVLFGLAKGISSAPVKEKPAEEVVSN